jgi:hypothetical protein
VEAKGVKRSLTEDFLFLVAVAVVFFFILILMQVALEAFLSFLFHSSAAEFFSAFLQSHPCVFLVSGLAVPLLIAVSLRLLLSERPLYRAAGVALLVVVLAVLLVLVLSLSGLNADRMEVEVF